MFRLAPFFFLVLVFACTSEDKPIALFEEQLGKETNITFVNTVVQDGDNNVLNYPYFFNGGGVGAGDFNNDGLVDLYFTGNQVSNKLYINKGDFKFEDITDKAGVAVLQGWKTGVTLADVNQDGWLDIYVCRSAMGDSLLRKNQLFINNKDLTFTEQAHQFGLDDSSYSTQAAFFDYDKDGDLDAFILNHSLPQYAGFSKLLAQGKNKRGEKFGSKLLRNDNGHFVNVSDKAGLINNVLSFGLGVAISDLNNDGWPDLYISNDFNEEDYLYINNGDGTFKNIIKEATGHVSLFSMGSETVDINNDGLTDIFTLDMMPEGNERIKLSSGDDNYDKYKMLIDAGFHHQSMRNMLQLNNGDGSFSEIGQLAGVSNTDWSWAPLFTDLDGDGFKDLFITNGYEKDYTNMQFLKFTMDEQIKSRQTGVAPDMRLIMDKMPAIQVGNYLFKNNGNLTFTKKTIEWGIDRTFKSNGAAYADLDNDGDPDLIINAMNEPAIIYKNQNSNEKSRFLKVDLATKNPTQQIIGTKLITYQSKQEQYFEFVPTRGFQSAMYAPVTIGLNGETSIDSLRIIWPDNKTQLLKSIKADSILTPIYSEATSDYSYERSQSKTFFELASEIGWKHSPVDTVDYKRQLLLPKMLSYSGPRIAKGDVNGDGFEDIYVCGPRHQAGALFIQQRDGNFKQLNNPVFNQDKESQDEDAVFFDSDGDGDLDLYVVSGGYLFSKSNSLLQDRLYINDGKGNFKKSSGAIPEEKMAGSCVAVIDVNTDEKPDLFVGSGYDPGEYPLSSGSAILMNDGKGHFQNVDDPAIKSLNRVTDVKVVDLNNDKQQDLLVTSEWVSIKVLINDKGALTDETKDWFSIQQDGWWNRLLVDDFDGDGDIDIVAGNYGLNSQFRADSLHPVTLVYKDFNKDGQVDPFFSYYIGDTSFPYASRDEALGQVGMLRPRFPDYTSYSLATLESIFKKDELDGADKLSSNQLKTMYYENKDGKFIAHELPIQAQYSPVYAIVSLDVDQDGDKDIILGGNESQTRVRIGKMDANKGVLLLNDGNGNFSYVPQFVSGLNFSGDVRDLITVSGSKGIRLITGINGEKVLTYQIH